MKHLADTIREAVDLCLLVNPEKAEQALTALSELETSLAQYEAGDMASAAAQGFRDGVASVAQQPQARPDFSDEWTGYLKDGETPFERFLRERKDLDALTKLYQRALDENERLQGQQPQAKPHKPLFADLIAQHPGLREELKAMDEQQPQAEAALAEADRRAGAAERELASCREDVARFARVRDQMKEQWGVGRNVSFDVVWAEALKLKQQAEAVPPGYVLVPVEPTLEMGWAYLDAANAKDPLRHHVFNHAGYRAMIRAAQGASHE